MSAQALTVYQSLLASGIDESRARRAAEAIDESIRDQVAAAGEKFVRKDEYTQRMENTPTRAETSDNSDKLRADMNSGFTQLRADMNAGFTQLRAEIAEVRKEARYNNRVITGLLAVLTLFTAKIIISGF